MSAQIIIHHHWAAVVSCGWAMVSACRLHVSMSCAVLCQIFVQVVSPLLGWSSSSIFVIWSSSKYSGIFYDVYLSQKRARYMYMFRLNFCAHVSPPSCTMLACTHTHTHACTHTCTHARTHTHINIHISRTLCADRSIAVKEAQSSFLHCDVARKARL